MSVTFEEIRQLRYPVCHRAGAFRYSLAGEKKKETDRPTARRRLLLVSGWLDVSLIESEGSHCTPFFTDYSVYQSEYSKHCVERFLGKKPDEHSAIIYNGINTELFSPGTTDIELRDTPEQKVFFTASDFRRKDQLTPLLEA